MILVVVNVYVCEIGRGIVLEVVICTCAAKETGIGCDDGICLCNYLGYVAAILDFTSVVGNVYVC